MRELDPGGRRRPSSLRWLFGRDFAPHEDASEETVESGLELSASAGLVQEKKSTRGFDERIEAVLALAEGDEGRWAVEAESVQ